MHITIYTDGGSLNNPGKAAIGFLIYLDGKLTYEHSQFIGIASNNVAEYTALITALTYVQEHLLSTNPQIRKITVFADSELMVKQLNGLYKVKHPDMKLLYPKVKSLEEAFSFPVEYVHVLREKNALADALVKKALGK